LNFAIQIAPSILLFLVVAVAALPAVAQARMLLLGAAAFCTVGSFASVSVMTSAQPDTLSLFVGGVAGAATGALLAAACNRLRGDYFALATLCFAELLRLILLINPPFPGPQGIPGVQRGFLFGISLADPLAMIAVAGLLVVLVSVVTWLLINSPWGAALQASSDNEVAARTSGLPTNKIRLSALVYAGFWCGIAGALSVRYLSLADAETFSLTESIMVLVVALLCGRPSVIRCLYFGAGIAVVSELLRFLASGAVRQIIFGSLLFILVLMLRDALRSKDTLDVRP
jgi:branched-chain amino acid transport system permease protein